MVSKKVLKNIGVFAMAVMLAAAPVLAVSANANEGIALLSGNDSDPTNSDPTNSDPKPETPAAANPSPVSQTAKTTITNTNTLRKNPVYSAAGDKLVSSVDGVNDAKSVNGVIVATLKADVLAAFGAATDATIVVDVHESNHGPAAERSINDGLAILAANQVEAVKGPVLDINAFLNGKKVTDINAPVNIVVGIPESFRQAGYEYAVILVQEGGRVSILTDEASFDTTLISFNTTGFGVFAIVKAPAGSFDSYK